jgi:RimJ/RimL family protein N-acetyltransferase
MLDHIFRFVSRVVFVVGEKNVRSRRAMEKIGGVLQVGRQDRGDGTIIPTHVFYTIARP